MNKIDIAKKEMFELFELIAEQTEMLKLHQGEIPQLYIDLLKKNILKFYETVHQIDQVKHFDEKLEKPAIEKAVIKEPEIKKDVTHEPPKTPEVKKQEIDKKSEVKEKPISMPERNTEPKIEEKPIAEDTVQKPDKEKPAISFSLKPGAEKPKEKESFIHPNSDLFTEAKPSVADKLSAKQDPTLADKMQQNQINDIKSAIGINDKFLFINELFEGDLKTYNQAVDRLNHANNKDEAMSSFISFKEKYKWEEEHEAVEKLKTILNRKFSVA